MNLSLALALAASPILQTANHGSTSGSHVATLPPAALHVDVLNFQARPAGTIAAEFFGRFGSGPVLISGVNPDLPGMNAAVVFNSAAPTGGDQDLGTPNEDFGGPGIGDGGSASGAFPNRRRQRNVLVVASDLTDGNGDGLVDDPGDSNNDGTSLTFDFSPLSGATLNSLTIIDVESSGRAAVDLIGPDGELLQSLVLPDVGNNGVAVIDLGRVPNVMLMHVALNGSAAIDDIVFEPFRGHTLTGRAWLDDDEDGLQGSAEVGIAGVQVALSNGGVGPVAVATTDEAGEYRFDAVAAGSYELSVLEPSLPLGAFLTACDVGGDDTIDNDCSPVNLELGFISSTVDSDFGYALTPVCAGTIGDLVFEDLNGNNIQDAGDVGLEGATVLLHDESTGDLVDIQITDADGHYLFDGLCEGTYAVSVDISSVQTPLGPAICNVGDDGSIDSECGPECVVIFEIDTLLGKFQDDTIDWGFRACGPCDGELSALSVRYNGWHWAFIHVFQADGTLIFAGWVEPGEILSLFGADMGSFGDAVYFFKNLHYAGRFHTDCSNDLAIGDVSGLFEVVAGSSIGGETLCAPEVGD